MGAGAEGEEAEDEVEEGAEAVAVAVGEVKGDPYTRVIFIRNFFIRNQAEILQIYYRVTSLLLLKELRLAIIQFLIKKL